MSTDEDDLSGRQVLACPLDTEILAALDRIRRSSPFAQSNQLSKFLTYIVDETLAGRSDKIIGYTVGVDVYGKPASFDPNSDAIVRVEAGRLRRQLEEYYREEGADDPVEIVVPKGTYAPQFRYRTSQRVVTATITPTKVGAVPNAGFDRGPAIAVLPFDVLGTDTDNQLFASGLTEETIANLARFKNLFVFSRTTMTKLAEDGADVSRLYNELGADFVLEGSVRKVANEVRVTAQLIDAAVDGHVFAEQFDRPCTPEGVFEIQDEIARHVSQRISDHHGPLGRYVARAGRAGQSARWETYIWIARFYEYYRSHDPKLHFEVREGLTSALELDPGSSDGLAALSIILLDEFRIHLNERTSVPALQQAQDHALLAVHYDPENAFAYQALALCYYHDGNVTEFRIAAERALELNPGHADLLADMGHCYWTLGDRDLGLSLLDRAITLSPVHPGWYHHARAVGHFLDGEFDEAILEIKKVPMPKFFWYFAFLVCFYVEIESYDEAADARTHMLDLYPDFASQARNECAIWQVPEPLAEAFISGWRKAGLEIAD